MAEAQNSKPLEILIIEDNEDVRELLNEMVVLVGGNATTAIDSIKGIGEYVARFNEGRPYDAVLTDLQVPKDGDGEGVVKAVKSMPPKTPVIIMTGQYARDKYQSIADKLGELKPDGYIQKPFRIETVRYFIDWVGLVKATPGNPPEFKAPTILPEFY